MSEGTSKADTLPAGLHNAYLFAMVNPLSFQIVLGSPMILYAKTLGASATVLGIIAGMMPLLVIFQIPAANYINRIGYKRFVFAGWSTRVCFIVGMALVPLTGAFLEPQSRLALMLMLLFCFNLSRGISSCAWLPWISELVPAALRGKYLVRDTAVQNLASFVIFAVSAAALGPQPRAWQFALLFGVSAAMGALSLVFLKRIPDVPIAETVRTSKTPVPWGEMLRFPPFRKLLREIVVWSVAYGGLGAFTVAFLKGSVGMAENRILLVTSTAFLGGLSSLWLLGSGLDRHGSKPVLRMAFLLWILILAGWISLAGGWLPVRIPIVLALQFVMGLSAALVTMANQRLAMAIVPMMGRNHFFALFSVCGNVTLGLAPILWGLLIDAIGPREWLFAGVVWNRYTIFFGAVAGVFVAALALARKLDEPRAASMEELLRDILIQSPQRFWLRFWRG